MCKMAQRNVTKGNRVQSNEIRQKKYARGLWLYTETKQRYPVEKCTIVDFNQRHTDVGFGYKHTLCTNKFYI